MTSPTLPPPPASAPCIGRDAELSRLGDLHREAIERGERLALVEGPTGVGKGRILRELKTRLRLDGGVVLEGHAESGRAFAPFAHIVDDALRFLAEVGREPAVELEAFACVQGCHRFWWQHQATLPGITLSAMAEDPQLSALEKRLRFFDAVRSLLVEVAEVRPPVIILHDLDAADRGTLSLLAYLVGEGSGPWAEHVAPERTLRALFVASVRTDRAMPASDGLAALRARPQTTLLPVGRLDDEGVRAYLQSPDLLRRVVERTGGMPEAIDRLLDGEPVTPEARVARALGGLSRGARTLIDVLAVLGRPAGADTLTQLAATPVDTAARQEFADCALLTHRVEEGTLLFSFRTARDREQTVGLMDDDARRALHRRIAMHFAASPESTAFAAHHAIVGRDFAVAVPLAMDAAQALAAGHDHAEAAALLESLLEDDADAHMDVREALTELYRTAGDYPKALEHARAVARSNPGGHRATQRVGQLLTLAGHHDEAAAVLDDARRLAEGSQDATAETESAALLAELHYQRAAYDEARATATRALDAAERLGLRALELHARNTLGRLALVSDAAADALKLFERNFALAVEAGLVHQEAQALTNMGVSRMHLGDLAGAELDFQRALHVPGASDTREIAIALENLAVLAHWQRDFRAARARYYDAVTLLNRLGNRDLLARVANNLGELYVAMGDGPRARAMCDFAGHMTGPGTNAGVVAEGLVLRGLIEALEGRWPHARTSFEAARDRFQGLGARRVSLAVRELVKVALAEGALDEARRWLAELAPSGTPPREASEIHWLRAEVARAAGENPSAESRRAVALAEEAGDPLALLPALISSARASLDEGDLSAATRAVARAQQVETQLTERVPEDARGAWSVRPLRRELTRVAELTEAEWSRADRAPRGRPRLSSLPPPPRSDRRRPEWDARYPEIVGDSPQITAVLGVLDKVAPSEAMVLVRGESGTGKELVAQALHAHSPRSQHPFIKVNCAALVETLLLSELFGHEKGAFTGAQARKKGRFELADGGTIFLDEIGDISAKTQVALLRVLQEQEFERVGGTQAIHVDVRIVAATHRDLEQMVREGLFREDLYYRLRGVMIRMPSLRERLEDLPALARSLLDRIAAERREPPKVLSDDALKLLRTHRWPGNVRELENVLRSVTLFSESPVLTPEDFAAFADTFAPLGPATAPEEAPRPALPQAPVEDLVYERVRDGSLSLLDIKKVIERECIGRALRETDGNITKAAALLGMKRPRLSQLVKQYGLGDAEAPDGVDA